jgi:hypothetical protein
MFGLFDILKHRDGNSQSIEVITTCKLESGEKPKPEMRRRR